MLLFAQPPNMQTTTKQVAIAMKKGLDLAYGPFARSVRKELFEILDDICLALAQEAFDNDAENYEFESSVISDICDGLQIPERRKIK